MATDDDLVTLLVEGGIPDADIFVGSKATLPEELSRSFITIRMTGGPAPEGTHNLPNVPAYPRPSAHIVARAEDYAVAKALAQRAFDILFPVRNRFVNGTWWRSISMVQSEPLDLEEDDKGRPRFAFNVNIVKRSSPVTSS